MKIVTRNEWGARLATKRSLIAVPSPRLWLHHTAGGERGASGMRQIQNFHMDSKRWSDIAYNFVIDPDTLTVYEGRGAGVLGGHTKGDNPGSHAICVMGNFQTETASPELLRLIADLVRHGKAQGWWGGLTGGHRDAPNASTACPGQHLYDNVAEIRSLSQATVTPQEDDEMTPAEMKQILDAINAEGAETRQWEREELKRVKAEILAAIAAD